MSTKMERTTGPDAGPADHSSGGSAAGGGGAHGGSVAALSLAALDVVYGDIGTSPIYAMRESLHGVHGVAATTGNVLGLLSLIFWALLIDPAHSTFILGSETLLATDRPGMALWRERLFGLLARNARRATKVSHLPSDRVLELGSQIDL